MSFFFRTKQPEAMPEDQASQEQAQPEKIDKTTMMYCMSCKQYQEFKNLENFERPKTKGPVKMQKAKCVVCGRQNYRIRPKG